jgi:restriction endonuclease
MIMTIAQRINRIQLLLQKADADLLAKIESMLEQERVEDTSVLTNAQKRELDIQEEEYAAGRGKTYTWQEIKQELVNKHGLQA